MKLRMLLAFLLLAVGLAPAQSFRGSILGTVTDTTGASIPGAQVTATSTDTGLTRTAVTDAAGNYSFSELPLGTYKVSATQSGFKTETIKGIGVSVGGSQRADLILTPGKVEESVEVTAEIPLVETSGNTIGGTLEASRVENLPVNGRDFTKLLTLVPGAGADASSVSDSAGSFGIFAINGNRGRSNNYLLDGTDMNDGYRNDPVVNEAGVFGTPATILPVDALAEIGILSNAEAEYGRNSGGVINMVTKSGTNSLHGSAFEDFRNTKLNARNFFNTQDQAQYPFHNNQFGGALGGPIVRDRTFFYAAYEGQRETGGLPNVENVPTQAQFNAYTGVINPVIANLLARNPWAIPGGVYPATSSALTVVSPFTNRVDSVIGKLDQHIGKDDIFTGRYFYGNSDQSFPLALGGSSTASGFNTVTPTTVHLIALSYTHVFSPKALLELRGGFNRFVESFKPQDSSFDPSTIGLVTSAGLPSFDFGLPRIQISGVGTAIGGNNSIPRQRVDSNSQFAANYSYNTGKHNYKFGYQFTRTTVSQNYDLGYRGRLKFASFSSFLAGTVDNGALQFTGNSRRHTFENNNSIYFQDNFRVNRKLTINYGLRYDYYGVIGEKNNLFSLYNASTGSLQQVGTSGGPSGLYPKDFKDFAPRLSFAYDVNGNGKTVLRAGWGVYYDGYSQDFFLGHFPFNTFNPGPAYNGTGPDAILSGSISKDANGNPIPIQSGVPIFTSYSPTTDAWTVDRNLRTPYVQNYNLNLQHQIANGVSLQVGYVGSTGKHLFRFRDINQPNIATFVFPNPSFNYINNFESTAFSNYNALQATLNIRNFRGFSSQVNYTWSHSIDNASDGEDFVPNAAQPDNSYNPRAEKANSNFDGRNRFTWDFNYAVPKLGNLGFLSSGWSLNGILRVASGEPYTINSFAGFNNSNEFFERPDLVGNPYAGTGGAFRLLNLSAFATPCNYNASRGFCDATTPNYHFGNLGRNAFVGPGFKNFDFSLAKVTKLGERATLQLHADFFNLFNHPNLSNPLLPNFAVDWTINGIDANGRGIGFLPATATPDAGIGNPFLGGGGPRNIQLGAKVTF